MIRKRRAQKVVLLVLKFGIIKKKRQKIRCGCQAVGIRRQAKKENNSTRC